MKKYALPLTVAAGCVFLMSVALRAQQVDAGIFNASDSTLQIRLRPASTVTALPLSNVVFTLRWLDSYGVNLGSPSSAIYSVSKQGGVQLSAGYRYQKFAAATAQTVTWSANVELVLMTVPVLQSGNGTGTFELVNDAWTAANNSSYYAELAGRDVTGAIYQGSVNGVPLPLTVTALHASVRDRRVLLRWQAAGVTDGIGFVVERREEAGEWMSAGMVPTRETDDGVWYSFVDALPPALTFTGTLVYRLQLLDADGSTRHSAEIRVQLDAAPPRDMRCEIYPSPASGTIGVSLFLPSEDAVSLRLIDILGRELRQLAAEQELPAGQHARTYAVSGLANGRYFIVMSGRTRVITIPFVLISNP